MSRPEVEIYTRRRCPRCTFARQLLARNDVAFMDHALEAGPDVRVMMRVRTGSNVAPQVLVRGRAVGGCDALHRMEASGELQRLLRGGPAGANTR
jgi:glutaredoxin 3